MNWLMEHYNGVLGLGFWGYVLATIITVQITIMAVTIYLHRDQTHRGLDLHPVLRHFFRLWLWLSTGMGTRAWVSVHRKHHALCETEDDPHSPKILGLRKVLFEGAELYKAEGANPETLEKYGRGAPDDWMERNVYSLSWMGIVSLVIADLVLFGVPGIIILAIQLGSIPFCAAGVINGVGHYWGYRNFECEDASTNIVPWAFLLGGEELHNNHHAFPSSAKFSIRRWEFDIGWLYIRIFEFLGLAKVKRVAPTPVIGDDKQVDLETLKAVIVNRMHVLRSYTKGVTLPVLRTELHKADEAMKLGLRKAKRALIRHQALLDERARERLNHVLTTNETLATVHEFRERLQKLWGSRHLSNESLLKHLKEWCVQAEESGIQALREFAQSLRGYALQPA